MGLGMRGLLSRIISLFERGGAYGKLQEVSIKEIGADLPSGVLRNFHRNQASSSFGFVYGLGLLGCRLWEPGYYNDHTLNPKP